jgi:hypothetical protein
MPSLYSIVELDNDDQKTTGTVMYSTWSCPHEVKGLCMRVKQRPCDPGMKGCILYGRFAFSDPAKNSPAVKRKLAAKKRIKT